MKNVSQGFAILVALAAFHFPCSASEVAIKRLTWAGAQISADNTTVWIDAIATDIWNGDAPGGFVAPDPPAGRAYALITHAHNDHFDAEGLRTLLGDRGYVICHEDEATYVASRGLRVVPARYYEPVHRGPFSFTALPASDGFGDSQVHWKIDVKGLRLFHGGDSLWHGRFASYGRDYGPFDAAFLPINGVRIERPELAYGFQAVMDPSEAVTAALLLQARSLVPIHYGLAGAAGYDEVRNPLEAAVAAAEGTGVVVEPLRPGEPWTLDQ